MYRIKTAEMANVHTFFTQVSTDTDFKKEVLIQLLHCSKSEKVQALKCPQSIKVCHFFL